MTRLLLISAAALAIAPMAHAETRDLAGFDGVSASGKLQVEVRLGAAFSVQLDGPRAHEVTAVMRGSTLELETPRNWFGFSNNRDTQVRITMPAVRALSASAGAELEAFDVRSETIALDASSGAELTVSGTCDTVNADASSGADLDAGELVCANANVDSSSGADARVYASASANADASSGSDIFLLGGARSVSSESSSGADVHRR